MNEKPNRVEERKPTPLIPHPAVWWVLWIAIMCSAVISKPYARLNNLTPVEGRWQYAGQQAIVTSVVILFLLGSVVIRWLILARIGPTRKGFAFFVAGLALVYGAFAVASFFYQPQALLYIVVIYLMAGFQFFPLFLLRKKILRNERVR